MNKTIETLKAYGFIAPNFIGFAIFTALPVLGAVFMSFYDGTFSTKINEQGQWQVDAQPVGLKNYSSLLGFDAVKVLGTVKYRRGQGEASLTVISPKEGATLSSLFANIASSFA